MSSGRLPCWSERAPVTGEARNCSSENSEPIRPEKSGAIRGSAAHVASQWGPRMWAANHTSEQHAVVFLLKRNPHGLPEEVYRTLQSVIHAILRTPSTQKVPHDAHARKTSTKTGNLARVRALTHSETQHTGALVITHEFVITWMEGTLGTKRPLSDTFCQLSVQHTPPTPLDLFEGECPSIELKKTCVFW